MSACVSPLAFYEEVMSNPELQKPAGEAWAWHANYNLSYFVRAYRAWQDPAWLDFGVKYYDYILDSMQMGPDGYMGWIGPYIYDNSVWGDVHVGDAILCEGLLDFAELVAQEPALEPVYGDKARRYVEVAEKHLFEKWDARGTWYEHGPYGVYFSWNRYLRPGDFSEWLQRDDVRNSSLSLPFNKNTHMGSAALKLYRITGKAAYRDKAAKIFAAQKSRMQLHGDGYVWNYWEPLVPWDVDAAHCTTRHWVNVHPYRNYQAGEVAHMVEAYHTGVVYAAQDMQRLINTNIRVMWNQDPENPRFRNSNAGIWPGPLPASNTAGTLWSALACFDETVRRLARFGSGMRGAIEQAYYQNVVLARPVSFERRYAVQDVREFNFPFTEARYLHMAFVIPAVIRPGEEAVIAAKSLCDGELRISLLPAGEEKELEVLYRGHMRGSTDGMSGMFMLPWRGINAAGQPWPAGDYRIRWTLNDSERREFPIAVTR